ncbi:hypothetical protein MATL_G00033010 [Megalops atlanticus]|uniref:Pyrroline-5-carboxylate reductase n=1 Tax=Megalops atlanticus TaxID=7932 RepID=A0A9D3TGH3_MEGAT|nr:hypothetical protein MATL_G00033010 [Megalops atlanticus]
MDSRGWGTHETRCLISIWAEESVQRKLEDSYHNRAIYEEISKKMEGNGYSRSWLQCQRKIKHLRNAFRKAKDSNNKSGRDSISCPFYEELDRVLGDRPSFCPDEGDVLDSELKYSQEPLFNSTMDAIAGAAVTLSNTTSAETQGDDGHSDDATGPDASPTSSSSQSSSASSSKRPSTSSSGQTRRKKSKVETILEAFSKAMCNNKDEEMLREMQQAQHAHEEKLFGMMMQSIASLSSTMASAQRPPGHAPSYPWYQPMPSPAPPSQSVPPVQHPHCNTQFNPPRQNKMESGLTEMKIGFIGAGNMAFGIAKGILMSGYVRPENVKVSAPSSNNLGRFQEMGVAVTHSNQEVVSSSRLVFLAVKPHLVSTVLQEVAPLVTQQHIVVSVAAGITIATLEGLLHPDSIVLRLMPNLPCMVQEGALLFCRGTRAKPEDGTVLRALLAPCGLVEEGPENWIDAHTGLSGSGVAFVYLFAEALAEGGVKMGIPSALAHRIAAQTVLGAGRLLRDSEKHPAQLRSDVCTPGGTTIFGLHVLEKGGVRAATMGAVEAATERARELGRK